jgi:anti-sigma regulatory factor (Ser/Thr protein kinase)
MHLSREPVALRDTLRETLDLVRPLAAQRSIQLADLDSDRAAGEAGYVLADRQRLTQVLLNLLGNAIKYNRDGGRVTLRYEALEAQHVRITVADTGPGIPSEKMARLFVPFDRLGAEQSRIEGTGLGLALSQRLITAMGGRIGVESTFGQGSSFWVELPLVEGPLARLERLDEPHPILAASFPARTILYIEDNLANMRLIELILEQRPGIKLLTAMQGQLGLELAREHQPDLILLDLHLPDISGYDVLLRRYQLAQHKQEALNRWRKPHFQRPAS